VGNKKVVDLALCQIQKAGHECLDCIRELRMEMADGTLKKMPRRRKIATAAGKPKRCLEHQRAKAKRDSTRRSNQHALKTHGITPEEYRAVYEAQGRKCAFPRCRATGATRRLAIDHDHDKARDVCGHDPKHACRNCFRGLCCLTHNTYLLGWFVHDLQDGLDYLADPPARRVFKNATAR